MLTSVDGAASRRELAQYTPYALVAVAAALVYLVIEFDLIFSGTISAARGRWNAAPVPWQILVIVFLCFGAVMLGPMIEKWSWQRSLVIFAAWSAVVMVWTVVLDRHGVVSIDYAIALLIPGVVFITGLIRQIQTHGRATFVKDMAITHKNALIQSVIENTHEGAFVADYKGRIIYVNRTGLELFGLEEKDVIGASVDILSPTMAQGRIGREISYYLDVARGEQKQIDPIETSGLRKDGSVFSIHLVVGVARFVSSNHEYERRKGDRFLYICNISDISARRQMIEAQQRALEHQVIANRAKSEFLANMSHELRTPLNAVIGFSEMLAGRYFGDLTEKQSGYVEFIHSSASHLLKLINDILDISKIEAGHADLQEGVVDVVEVINACLALVKHRAAESKIVLRTSLLSRKQHLYCDERRLKQVLLNLLSNAVKFTPSGGQVEVVTELDPDGSVAISVVDSGVGIAPKDVATALASFGQVDSGLNRKFEGTGLGLPLSKSLMQAHNGTLTLNSSIGVGTTVTCRFPAERTRSRPTEIPELLASPPMSAANPAINGGAPRTSGATGRNAAIASLGALPTPAVKMRDGAKETRRAK